MLRTETKGTGIMQYSSWFFRSQAIFAATLCFGYPIHLVAAVPLIGSGQSAPVMAALLFSIYILPLAAVIMIPVAAVKARDEIARYLGGPLLGPAYPRLFYALVAALFALSVVMTWAETYGDTGPLSVHPYYYWGGFLALLSFGTFLDMRIARLKKSISPAPWTVRPGR